MITKLNFAAIVLTAIAIAGCGDSSTKPVASPVTTQQRMERDLKAVGEDIKDAGHAVAEKVDPVLQKAKEETKDLIHRAADKVADATAPPATQPAVTTQP